MSLFDKHSENNNLRMSQIGKPDRQVWYQSRDIEKIVISDMIQIFGQRNMGLKVFV